MRNDKVFKLTSTALIAALYAVASILINIPIADRISIDAGYIVLGLVCGLFVEWQNMFIAGFGCIAKAMIQFGMFPTSWFPANLVLGYGVTKTARMEKPWQRILFSTLVVFVCIAGIKTLLQVFIFSGGALIPVLTSNLIASVSDSVCLIVGMEISKKINWSRILNNTNS